MVQADIFALEKMVHYLLPIAEGFIKGYCLYRFVKPFMISPNLVNRICSSEDIETSLQNTRKIPFMTFRNSKKKSAACGALAYFLTMLSPVRPNSQLS